MPPNAEGGPPGRHPESRQRHCIADTPPPNGVSTRRIADVTDLERYREDRRRFGPPSTFSLTPRELAAEVQRCRAEGWQRWEIRVRFGRVVA